MLQETGYVPDRACTRLASCLLISERLLGAHCLTDPVGNFVVQHERLENEIEQVAGPPGLRSAVFLVTVAHAVVFWRHVAAPASVSIRPIFLHHRAPAEGADQVA